MLCHDMQPNALLIWQILLLQKRVLQLGLIVTDDPARDPKPTDN
jgi:hypothetical protein